LSHRLVTPSPIHTIYRSGVRLSGMGGELVPDAKMLMADVDRERVVARLHSAVAEGRITIGEFEDRMAAVLAARTFGEVVPYVADLPPVPVAPIRQGPITVRGASLRREGRWPVPALMQIEALGSGVHLDYAQAVITTPVVEVEVFLRGSGTKLILPEGSTVDLSGISLTGSSTRQRGIGTDPQPGRTHFVVHGEARGSSVKASYPRQPRRWRWYWPFGRRHTNGLTSRY
jgi:hypothetical protein